MSSDSDCTRAPVSTRPPDDSSALTMAPEIVAEPPIAAGQPKVCAAVANATPIAEEARVWNGRKAWAAVPANSAQASGVRHRRPRTLAGNPAKAPKCASFSGCAGRCSIGRRKSSVTSGTFRDSGPKTARQVAASAARPLAVAATSCRAAAPEPPSRGVGVLHRGPCPLQTVGGQVNHSREGGVHGEGVDS